MQSRKESAARANRSGALSVFFAVGLVVVVVLLVSVVYEVTHIAAEHDVEGMKAMSNAAIASSLQTHDVPSVSKQKPAIGWDEYNPLGIPRGEAQNLPSIRVNDTKADSKRSIYGGKGDKAHLGGFTDYDRHGVSPGLWGKMITDLGIKSLIDVGCGRGISSLWFHLQGVDTLCVEGSHDAVEHSLLPQEIVVEHDYSRGPWWPAKTYDAVWSVEFLEHVGVNYHFNYISTFRKAAIIFATSSRWGGWHHVEVHENTWWIRKYQSYGFVYDSDLTTMARTWATQNYFNRTAPDGGQYYPQHLIFTLKVFINPVVAALPGHAHLFFEHGCYDARRKDPLPRGDLIPTRPCRAEFLESELPKSFVPLKLDLAAQIKWEDTVRASLGQVADAKKKDSRTG